ncbi:MAG: NosD domain-containing protein [Candidatus Bathyarchaeia archaeon]
MRKGVTSSRKTVSVIVLFLLVISTSASAFNIQPVKASGIILIRADGSVDPSSAPISTVDNITYTLTDNIGGSIQIERDSIVVNGAGYTVQDNGAAYQNGLILDGINHVTIKNAEITNFSDSGIWLIDGSSNSIYDNNVTNNGVGIWLDSSSNSTLSGNNVANNYYSLYLTNCSENSIFHNSFVNNTNEVHTEGSANIWDDGYPSGGNYWSDYNGMDLYSGSSQNETGKDGIGDTPYVIDTNNRDNYPLVKPYPCIHAIAAEGVGASKTIIGQGFTTNLSVAVANRGHFEETLKVTVNAHANGNPKLVAWNYAVTLTAGDNSTAIFVWNTSGSVDGNYTLTASVEPVPNETDTPDNTCSSWVAVTIPGDVNGDFTINILDAITLSNAFLTTPSSAKWNPNADINGDNLVNILDAIILANNFLQQYP